MKECFFQVVISHRNTFDLAHYGTGEYVGTFAKCLNKKYSVSNAVVENIDFFDIKHTYTRSQIIEKVINHNNRLHKIRKTGGTK